jgi:acyl dehydratase
MTAPAASDLAVGDEVTPFSRTVTQEQVRAYADASGDHNPIHLDPEFARSVGLPGTIAHGLLEMGILAEAISSGTVISVDDAGVATLSVAAASDRGDRVLTNGRATVRLSR